MTGRLDLFHSYELFFIVERLSMHDKRRIVRLIQLFQKAPDDLREATQLRLCELVASRPHTYAECAEGIDEIIEGAELEFDGDDPIAMGDAQVADMSGRADWGR